MTNGGSVYTRACAAALALAAAAGITLGAQSATVATHGADLAQPRVDLLVDGRVVISFDATGELAGSLTLNLQPAADGGYTGDWALIVAETDTTDPETGAEPEAHHDEAAHPHKDFLRVTPRGTLGGAITGATVAIDADGRPAVAAALRLDAGTQEFAGASGSGNATASSLSLVF